MVKDYVLPDFSSIKKGFCKVRGTRLHPSPHPATTCHLFSSQFPVSPLLQPPDEMLFSGKYKTGEQILRLANERFAVPEMLLHPSDIGIQEMGVHEAIVDSIQSMPEGACVCVLLS